MDAARTFLRTTDPKLRAAVGSYLLTLAVAKAAGDRLGRRVLAPGYPSAVHAVAFVAAVAAGYRVSNDGTVLRTVHESGNATPPR
ncbi:MAG: hypothetical protein ACR2NH_04095 [Solirubrobacteraceae bacterium]